MLLNLSGEAKAKICEPVSGDHVAVVGDNRKLLVFPLTELPEMGRGKGVRLQKYRTAACPTCGPSRWPTG